MEKKMKCYKKQMPGFCVTYLHNPFECAKCLDVIKSQDDKAFEKSMYKVFAEKDETLKSNIDNKSVPLNNVVPKTRTVSKVTDFITPLPLTSTPLSSSKYSRKKVFGRMDSANYRQSSHKSRSLQKSLKKTSERKQTSKSLKKSSSDKIPGKGTLKRKRWFIEKLQQRNENYEDDLLEDKKFGHFQNLLEDERNDNPENYTGINTPIFPFSLSPRESTPSPDYTDCYSPEELSLSRKRGEEYQYQLMKRRKLDLPADNEPKSPKVEKGQQSCSVLETLVQVERILSSHTNNAEKSDTEEDPYFSDLLK